MAHGKGSHDHKGSCRTLAFSLSWKETSGRFGAVNRETWASEDRGYTKAAAG